jgi:DNA-binding NtrC family response regulator
MPAGLQAKLLHVLQDNEFTKLGSNRPVHVDVRIIAATNRDLDAMMRAGTFREDLYYRLQVIELHVPPLRERREEIPQLIEFFLVKYSERYGRPMKRPSDPLRDSLLNYPWPGNVRELENVIKRFVILQDEGLVMAELKRARANAETTLTSRSGVGVAPAVPAGSAAQAAPVAPAAPAAPAAPVATAAPVAPVVPAAPATPVAPAATATAVAEPEEEAPAPDVHVSLPELAREAAMRAERTAIQQALDRFRWNRRKAADYLGVSYKTLLNKMKECGISEQQN